MKKAISVIAAAMMVLLFVGCGSNKAKPSGEAMAKAAASAVNSVIIQSSIPFEKTSRVASNIRKECKLGTQLSTYIATSAAGIGIKVTKKKAIKSSDKGNVLIVNIVDAVSSGNAFVGHRKYTEIKGTLYKSGSKIASFRASRTSGGGMFAGFKGSCSVLGRTVKTLGKDVSTWLKNPVDKATLGDM